MLAVVPGEGSGHEGGKDGSLSLIDEIVCEGARRMLAEALQAEVDAYIARFAEERDENGRRLVVRNGYHQPREIITSAGAVEVTVPRVNDKRTDPGATRPHDGEGPLIQRRDLGELQVLSPISPSIGESTCSGPSAWRSNWTQAR